MSGPNLNQPNQQAASSSAPSVDTRAGRGGKKEKLGGGVHSIATKITKKLVWVFGGIIFAGVFFWGIIEIAVQGPNPVVPIAGLTGHFSFDRFLLLGGILALIPPAIMYFFESKRRDSIDNSIPHLIRDIADAGRSGMTLTRAIEISAERDYGPLTTEIKKLIAKISFRVPLERALQFFADRTGTMLSRRTSMLVAEANKSGGDIQESMESVAKHVQEIQYLERKRRATLRPFIGVMYITPMKGLNVARLFLSKYWISCTCLATDSILSWISPPDLLASAMSIELRRERVVPVESAKYWSALSSGTLKLIFAISFLSSLVNGP